MKRANEESLEEINKQETMQNGDHGVKAEQQKLNGNAKNDDKDANDHQEENEQDPAGQNGHSSQIEINPAKRQCSDADEIRLLIPSKLAGGVIGKAGCNIQKMRNDFDARVRIADSRASPDRVLTIYANLEDCGNVIKALLVHLDKDSSDEYDLRFLLHQSLAGCVIGKQGATIKEIRNQFGCSVKVFPDCAPFSTDRVVQIIGKEDQCIKAFLEIFGKLIKGQPTRGQVINYNADNFNQNYASNYGGYVSAVQAAPRDNRSRIYGRQKGNVRYNRGNDRPQASYVSPWTQPMNNGYSMSSGYSQNYPQNGSSYRPPVNYTQQYAAEPKLTTQVSIKSDMVGALIGRRGERINEIRMQSKAMIQIDDPKRGSSMERIITITGSSKQIQTAQYMLQQCIRNYCTNDTQQ